MNSNPFSHIDLRVPGFAAALPFYEKLLPALGFTRTFHSARWRVFAAEGELLQPHTSRSRKIPISDPIRT